MVRIHDGHVVTADTAEITCGLEAQEHSAYMMTATGFKLTGKDQRHSHCVGAMPPQEP